MNLAQCLEYFRNTPGIMGNISGWLEIPEREAVFEEFPECIPAQLRNALKSRGITKLYSHQAQAVSLSEEGKNTVIVTPTASGKTLCYNIPVLSAVMREPESRALYLFPTKALSQDQVAELYGLIEAADVDIKTYTYDGDTPQAARKAVRQAGHIVVTNPDMLHGGILPHHTKWIRLFENLKYVVIDEIHNYRGVFGSHLANVIRRLKRVCEFYGSSPRFICCSATIANPLELASKIIEEDAFLIDKSGAPQGRRNLLIYNPPVVNRQLGIRKSSLLEAKKLAEQFILNNISTIVFTRSRLNAEVMLTYLTETTGNNPGASKKIRGYRGGYLPNERREIEKGLRNGSITAVVSTNALELGIDIGSLEACVICGYPGTISSAWQQAGRAGRRAGVSAAVLVTGSSALDQYIAANPEYLFDKSPEHGLINPNNLHILYNHLKCAAFELPFADGEKFGVETTAEALSYMEDSKLLRHTGGRWHWMSDVFPAEEISLRSASGENFIIVDVSSAQRRVIGETDRFSAPMLIHEEAIYIHGGTQYQVEKLDFENKKAYVRRVDVDYYTDANLSVELRVLDVLRNEQETESIKGFGEVSVRAIVTMFKKIRLHSHENIGAGPVDLPETEMHTMSYWLSLKEELLSGMGQNDIQNGLTGLSNILANVAPLYLMCDPADIRVLCQVKSAFTQLPTIYIYESYPGGVGFSEKLYEIQSELLSAAFRLISACACESGCPSCVGPANEFAGGNDPKKTVLSLLSRFEGVINEKCN